MKKRNKKDNDADNKELETAIRLLDTLEKTAFWNLIHSSFVQIATITCMVLKHVYFQCHLIFQQKKDLV